MTLWVVQDAKDAGRLQCCMSKEQVEHVVDVMTFDCMHLQEYCISKEQVEDVLILLCNLHAPTGVLHQQGADGLCAGCDDLQDQERLGQ